MALTVCTLCIAVREPLRAPCFTTSGETYVITLGVAFQTIIRVATAVTVTAIASIRTTIINTAHKVTSLQEITIAYEGLCKTVRILTNVLTLKDCCSSESSMNRWADLFCVINAQTVIASEEFDKLTQTYTFYDIESKPTRADRIHNMIDEEHTRFLVRQGRLGCLRSVLGEVALVSGRGCQWVRRERGHMGKRGE